MTVGRSVEAVRARISESALHAGRAPESVTLVGVSKGAPPEAVVEAVAAGLTDLGENRVQEAEHKIREVARSISASVLWHLLGHLQANKIRSALGLFDRIQSVDSIRLAERLSAATEASLPVFLEVQFVESPNRFGFTQDAVGAAFASAARLPHLSVEGLMTVAPLGLDSAATRRVFRSLREIRDKIQEAHPGAGELDLSMGMTDDFPVAIEEGATIVRIGRAIFAA